MKPFLKELAEKMVKERTTLDELTFIFPNRRAALYFEHHLAQSLEKPKWAPRLFSIEEYFRKESKLLEPDRLTLIYKLHQVYNETLKRQEAFDRFYFWGDMLLRDFDELDKYMVNAAHLFKDLSKIKELDEVFDYLTDEQKTFLKNFWIHFSEKESNTKDAFLLLWQKLPRIYSDYTKGLRKDGMGYEGMIHREVAERISKAAKTVDNSNVVFAGFNALTKAEAVLISKMVEGGAQVFWDTDAYYMEDRLQEAGLFLRQYRDHSSLKSTFPPDAPDNIRKSPKKLELTGVPLRIGQAKLAGGKVAEILSGMKREDMAVELARTVIVLPDESMLLPVLHSLPDELQDINVTMGYPLRETPLYSLVDLLVEMQLRQRKNTFSHREVLAILGHSYVVSLAAKEAEDMRNEIITRNRVFVNIDDLQSEHPVFPLLFRLVEPTQVTHYLLDVVRFLGTSFAGKQSFDREYAYHFYKQLAGLDAILKDSTTIDWRGYQKLLRQVIQSQRMPFSGEPLRGLQVMGVLETRNLDFDNVIFLSLNEGMLPAAASQGSYIPFAVRRAYGLPTNDHRDAIYAYLFYRLLQRSKNVYFYYNTEPDIIGNGEMSRFVQQVLLESGLQIERKILYNPVDPHLPRQIEIPKTSAVMEQLNRYVPAANSEARGLSPSHLNDYIECSLRFYLKHVARLMEADQIDEDVDARVFGNIIHDSIHWFYDDLRQKDNGWVKPEDLRNQRTVMERYIDKAFINLYKLREHEAVIYEGQRVVVKESALAFLLKILEKDEQHAPFQILLLEHEFSHDITVSDGRVVKIGGKIDRADRKDTVTRIIDYKTGGDDSNFESIPALFTRDGKRNKAAFQTFHYAFAFRLMYPLSGEKLMPGLINRKSLFDSRVGFGHTMGKVYSRTTISDATPYLDEFGKLLEQTVQEIFDPSVPFRQTTYEPACEWCLYKGMCRR
ncbi:MAG: PD-(D/E)XK nuclease family protein [Bacteroidetes bacterium]|nr:PD-(D/E)XK nuclease family protein [Bacteroidota bacterium]